MVKLELVTDSYENEDLVKYIGYGITASDETGEFSVGDVSCDKGEVEEYLEFLAETLEAANQLREKLVDLVDENAALYV